MPAASGASVHHARRFAGVRTSAEAPTGPAAGELTSRRRARRDCGAHVRQGDGQNVAFGTLGSNTQQVIRVARTRWWVTPRAASSASRGRTATTRSSSDGRCAMPRRSGRSPPWTGAGSSTAGPTRPMSSCTTASRRSPGTSGGASASTARVTASSRATSSPPATRRRPGVDAAPRRRVVPDVGSCERAIHDTATGVTTRDTFDGEPPCSIHGVLDGRIVATMSRCDAGVDESVKGLRDVDGGEWTTIFVV